MFLSWEDGSNQADAQADPSLGTHVDWYDIRHDQKIYTVCS